MEHYDVIIIGTGAGGGTLAHKLAPSENRILLLDSHRRAAPHRVRARHRNHLPAAQQLTHEQLTVKNQSIGAIMSLKDNTREHHHHGTFADGIAHPESFAGEDHVGTFAEGVAHPESFANEDHVGTFAEGIAHPESYAGEDHVGTFAEGA